MIRMTSIQLAAMALVAATMATRSAPVSAGPVPAFEMTGGFVNTGGAAGVGYEFSTSTARTVYALGTYDHDGTNLATLSGSVTVDIFQETPGGSGVLGSLMATATVSASDPPTSLTGGGYTPLTDAFRYHTLTSAVPLPAGNYVILSSLASTQNWLSFATGGTSAIGVTFGNSAYNTSVFGSSPVIINPGNLFADFGPNFLVNAVPEPSTFVLGAVAAIGLLYAARYRRRECNA
jgi:PEP-CTERM motif-containing protein